MRIITSILDDIVLQEGEYHTITFSSSMMQMEFRQLLEGFFRNKKGEYDTQYIYFVDEKDVEMKAKDFYFINFDCNIANLTRDKDIKKSLHEILLYYLENDSNFVEQYMKLNNHMENFIHSVEFKKDDLLIEFMPSKRTMNNFIKSLDINFEFNNNEYVPNYILRNYIIEMLLDLNIHNKKPILFLAYPEADVGNGDFIEVIQLMQQLNVTTIVLTAQKDFLQSANIEHMFLIDGRGTIYDVKRMRRELEVFKLYNGDLIDEKAKQISYLDYREDYNLLEENVKTFLQSDKF